MRQYREPTARNLLHDPKVMGVSLPGLVCLSFSALVTNTLTSGWRYGPILTLSMGALGYASLRAIARFTHLGSEERPIFAIEQFVAKYRKQDSQPKLRYEHVPVRIYAPETMTESEMLYKKSRFLDFITALRPGETSTLRFSFNENGVDVDAIKTKPTLNLKTEALVQALRSHITYDAESEYDPATTHAYSLINLPATTDPLWIPALLRRVGSDYEVFVRFEGVDYYKTKRLIETARRRNAGATSASSIDGEVSFEESSRILEGLVRGDETLVRISLVVTSYKPLDLDPNYFIKEKNPLLALSAVTGLRRRSYRSFLVRSVTAADIAPTLEDPLSTTVGTLKTRHNRNAHFNPTDDKLDALHWLVVGASGAGKSFFTSLILRRNLQRGLKASVLFLDHNRGFKRFLTNDGHPYVEPHDLNVLNSGLNSLLTHLNTVGAMAGLELSELTLSQKKQAARTVLQSVSRFLKERQSEHTLYLVLDECWNFLRDEPTLVQQAFREFRKLNGAAIAITQSLSDFLRDESGQSIVQNAPVRILLRQGEDMAPYRGFLGLNDVEVTRVRELRQVRGEYSEFLIKTPYLSRILKLYPTPTEHELLRTDNLRRSGATI